MASCAAARAAVSKEWSFADVAVVLARQRPNAAASDSFAATEAYRVAGEKQRQLYKAECLHTRALHLKAAAAVAANSNAGAPEVDALNEALAALQVNSLVRASAASRAGA